PVAWWNEATFYEVFVRSFYDSNGDGIGDLNGLTQKLDYLNDGNPNTTTDLGVNALWLMPIHPSPSYHGYDVTDYYQVNPEYGTLDDFKHLLVEAHKRNIRVVIDFVMNHTSNQHPQFIQSQNSQSPYRDWYLWSDNDPGGVGPWGEQVWHAGSKGGYYYGVFWEGMPDLNYKNPAVVTEMEKVARFWLQEVGVDGFRVDGARYVVEDGKVLADSNGNHAWFKQFHTFYKGVNPNAMTVGEIWTSNDAVAKYAQGDQLDMVFDFDLASALVSSARSGSADAARIGLAIATKLLPTDHTANFLTNHDMNRVMVELGNDVNKAKRAATLLFTAPGTPFIYYGEEIGMVGKKPDEDLRLPMQWSADANAGFTTGDPWRAPAADYTSKNVATQLSDSNSLHAHYQALINVRNAHPALRIGDGFPVSCSNGAVLGLLRASPDETVLVVTNLRDEPISDYRLTLETGPLVAGATYTSQSIWGQGPFAPPTVNAAGGFVDYQPTATLAPGETLIIQLVKAPISS
ncbi:MAG: alpha-amylase family glycosyl hydrolase, partial [Chloroflexi bacterium]|nr:alpha-amylase family glycosyl hydrolase [Chloroflexota bacterium]